MVHRPHFSLPAPQMAILLLSGDQTMSLIVPLMGWYSYFKMCSFCVVSQMRTFPEASTGERRACVKDWKQTAKAIGELRYNS